MKAFGIIAAAVVGFFAAPTAANAYVQQPVTQPAVQLVSHADVVQRWDRDDRRWDSRRYGDRRWDRRNRSYRRHYNRGRHYGYRNSRWRYRNACYTRWRYGRPVRVCNRVRYRY